MIRVASLVLLLTLVASPSRAFYETENVDLRATALVNESVLVLPRFLLPFDDGVQSTTGASLRLLGSVQLGEYVNVEAHALQAARGATAVGLVAAGADDSLTWSQRQSLLSAAALIVDRAVLRFDYERLTVKIGRQPINLSTSFYFTPNDFFAPFAAQTFFRIYKPGVDAARVNFGVGELSELSLVAVLGADARVDDGAVIGRAVTVFGDFEFAVLGGRLERGYVAGGSFQGELFEWLGIRGEGNVAFPEQGSARAEVSVNVDHRFESTLSLRVEVFYNGSGATEVADYDLSPQALYRGRVYSAFGAGYELHPLLVGESLLIVNWTDRSALASVYLVYSLDDEMELAASANVPVGARPTEGPEPFPGVPGLPVIRSEFGTFPGVVDVQFRAFF